MNLERSIVIGSDHPTTLPFLMDSLKLNTSFSYNIVSANRLVDLINITKSLSPDLIILSFRNNQHILTDFISYLREIETPILCLAKRKENELLRWDKKSIVFTYPLECLKNEDCLHSQIQSIFLLKKEPTTIKLNKALEDSKNLSRYVMELDQKVEVLLKVKERISCLYPNVDDPTRIELNSIANSIKTSINDNKLWDDFKLYFEKTNPNFLFALSEKHPELTIKDLKYCCYLKMNMTNNDITNLLGINQESVRTHKYRLKKKMAFPKELDLINYLRSVA